MKSYTIKPALALNMFRLQDDSKPDTNYQTCTLPALLHNVAKLSREGARIILQDRNGEERVICHQA